MNFIKISLLMTILLTNSSWGQFINHAPIPSNSNYSPKAEDFIQEHFLSETEKYSPAKIQAFAHRLMMERDFIMQQIFETTRIEEIEVRLEDGENSLNEAKEELDSSRSSYAFLFDKYLLPKTEALLLAVQKNENCTTKCDGLVDEMLLGYSAIFSPKLHRSLLPFDTAAFGMLRTADGYIISKENAKNKPEANNLVAGKDHLAEINSCLEKSVKEDTFLSLDQLDQLLNCEIDISKLNPIRSPLWQNNRPSHKKLRQVESYNSALPSKGIILKYKKMRFTGFGSPKFTVEFKDEQGKNRKLKVKLGEEVHTDPVLSALGKMLGLHQDDSVYRDQITVKFKNQKQYDQFLSQMIRKYTVRFRNHLIKIKTEGGKVFATFRYVQLEANRSDTIKLNSIEQTGWDFLNRREFRGMLLWFAWVNMRDTRNGNWRVQLHVDENGKITPQISQQDVGQGLMGSQAFIKNPISFLPHALGKTHLNSFEKSIISWSQETLHIYWTDTLKSDDTFAATTYNDLKWMARKIADLKKEDIEYALSLGGLTQTEQELFVAKLINRRNEFVEAFKLEDDYEQISNVDIDDYNVPGIAENGKIIKASLKNSGRYQTQISPIFYFVNFIATKIPLNEIANGFVASIGRDFGVHADLAGGKIPEALSEKTQFFNHPGIRLGLTRGVRETRFQQFEDKSQRFYTVDRLSIELDLRSGAVKKILGNLPLTLQASVKVLKIDLEHFQPMETVAEAYKTPFRIFSILTHFKEYLAYHIKSGEIFNVSSANGISFAAELNYKKVVRFGAELSYVKSTPTYFHRNYFGELEIYKDTRTEKKIRAYVSAGLNTNFFFLPFIGYEFEMANLKGNSKLYRLWSKKQELGMQSPSIKYIRDRFETKILDTILSGGINAALPLMRLDYDMDYEVKTRTSRFFLLLLSERRVNQYSQFDIELEKGENVKYHRYLKRKEHHLGDIDLAPTLGGLIYLKGNQEIVEAQLDEKNPNKFVVIQNVYQYKGSLKRKRLPKFIDKLNNSFSENLKTPFFSKMGIPGKNDVNKYKKVLSHNRIFYYGDKLFTRLAKLSTKDLKQMGENLVASISRDKEDEAARMEAQRIMDKLVKASHYLYEQNYEKFLKTFSKFIQILNVKKNGMAAVLSIFKKDELFATGEIYGILESFSTMSQKHTNILNRRYTGKSFGDYKRRPPIWKYINDNPIMINTLPEILERKNLKNIYGVLPTGEPIIR